MRWARLGSYRLTVDWNAIEPDGDGNRDWEDVDYVVEATARRGIRLMLTMYGSPPWLNPNWRTLPVKSVRQIRRWKGFLADAVGRYGSRGTFWLDHPDVPYRPVTRWQIWNEPNIRFFARPVSPARYGRLLRASSRSVDALDPFSKIVSGGLYGKPPRDTGLSASNFLRRLYHRPGTRRSLDLVAIHPYARTTRSSLHRTRTVRRAMDANGDRRKRILITELGWGSDATSGFGRGSERAQADQLRSVYRSYLRARNQFRLDSIYWFGWSDLSRDIKACVFCYRTGLFGEPRDPKPAWYELLNFTHAG